MNAVHQPKKKNEKTCCNFMTNLFKHNLQKILLMTLLFLHTCRKICKVSQFKLYHHNKLVTMII